VGYDVATRPRSLSNTNQDREDPLFDMLVKLQEAAGLPSPTENSENGSESGTDPQSDLDQLTNPQPSGSE